jgi:hypothetical protein
LRIGIRERLGVNICERFPGIRFNERLLVGDELVHYLIGDIGLSCLNAIAYARGRRDTFFLKKEPVLRNIFFRSAGRSTSWGGSIVTIMGWP